MSKLTCHRPGCNKSLPPGRLKYCGKECAAQAQQEQLEAITVKRREERAKKPPTKCAIPSCTGTFHPTSSSHKYCCDACSLKGLQAAIDRQRQRREVERNKRIAGRLKQKAKLQSS